ncbi:hypothetical protein K458DRAFT_422854 [Lentithecium fluviatile CBS 122367]|uniref:Uncharacterized protein n=1 Tax=Lentithecium fluviatile CBS 122367 TaxID=1168545 RepID=A0A6G1IKN4_9PLEO|nr:hypothetical protein K458DRAFT_422854 [Lentithecium fluviatile CBS 122367]
MSLPSTAIHASAPPPVQAYITQRWCPGSVHLRHSPSARRHAEHLHLFAAAPAAVLSALPPRREERAYQDCWVRRRELDKLESEYAGCAD